MTAGSHESSNAQFVRRLFDEGWSTGRFGFLEGATASAIPFTYNGVMFEVTPESLPGLVVEWREGFPDLRTELRHVIAREDLVAASLTLRGTHLGQWRGVDPSGVSVAVEEMMFFRFADGILVEMWEVFDDGGLFRQINAGGN